MKLRDSGEFVAGVDPCDMLDDGCTSPQLNQLYLSLLPLSPRASPTAHRRQLTHVSTENRAAFIMCRYELRRV
jgi:hypothetical protein